MNNNNKLKKLTTIFSLFSLHLFFSQSPSFNHLTLPPFSSLLLTSSFSSLLFPSFFSILFISFLSLFLISFLSLLPTSLYSLTFLTETIVPGQPNQLSITPSKLLPHLSVTWQPPTSVDVVMVRGYILGYGVGAPDQYKVVLEAGKRSYVIKAASESASDIHQPMNISNHFPSLTTFTTHHIFLIHHHHPPSPTTTIIHHHHPPPLSTTIIHHHHPPPSSTTTTHHHHPPPPPTTIIHHHHHPPPSSTIIIYHHPPPPSSTTIIHFSHSPHSQVGCYFNFFISSFHNPSFHIFSLTNLYSFFYSLRLYSFFFILCIFILFFNQIFSGQSSLISSKLSF